MYSSSILSKALVHVYESSLWRGAMEVTYLKAEDYDFPLVERSAEDYWMSCPPPSLVTFVGTLVSWLLIE